MSTALREALTRPASFFPREAEEPGLQGPVLVVTVVALVGLLGSVPVFRAVLGAVPAGAEAFVVVGLAMTLWSAWVWTHAVAAARDLSVRDAAVCVGVVVVAGILLGLVSTFAV